MREFEFRMGCSAPSCEALISGYATLGSPYTGECQQCGHPWQIEIQLDGTEARIAYCDGISPEIEEIFESDQYYDHADLRPYDRYIESYDALKALLGLDGREHDGDLQRMLYAHAIATLEAFLCDKLIFEIENEQYFFDAVINGTKLFEGVTFTLREIHKDADLPRRMVREKIQSLVFHRLEKVAGIYKAVFGFEFFPRSDNAKFLFKAVGVRHDCIHRNGRDRFGILHRISSADVAELIKQCHFLVTHIEQSLNPPLRNRLLLALYLDSSIPT